MTHHDTPCHRYAVYGFYKTKVLPKTPELLYAKAIAGHDTRQALKKLSSDVIQIRSVGRKLAKIGHRNPIALFGTIVDQIEAYDNLITPCVDSFKYVKDSFIYSV